MPLDFDKLKVASADDLFTIALCEFSRLVDAHERLAAAVERMAPTALELDQAAAADVMPAADVPCPHPTELRINLSAMGQEPYTIFKCGVCQETVGGPTVEG